MKYILMMHAPRGDSGDYAVSKWPPEALQAHIKYMMDLNRDLNERGELVGAEGLAPPSEARIIRAAKDGSPTVSDGPFPETKEFLAGFWLVDVDSDRRAYEIAARASAAPGPKGAPLATPIEVRLVPTLQAPPE